MLRITNVTSRKYPLSLLSWKLCINFWVNLDMLFIHLNHLQATFVKLPIHCHSSTWGMVIPYLNHIHSCICYWLFYTYVWHDIFHPWFLFQPLVTYQHLLIILTRLLFSLNMPAMSYEQDLFHKFLGTYFIKLLNMTASIRVSLYTYKSWYWPRFCNSKSSQTLLACL